MNSRATIFFTLFGIALPFYCLGQTAGPQVLPDHDDSLKLTPAQIREDEVKGMDGSQDAANKLANYYQGVKLDIPKALWWYQIAAENGSSEAMWNYYVVTEEEINPDLLRRGRFWLKKAANLGYKEAIERLKDESSLDLHKKSSK